MTDRNVTVRLRGDITNLKSKMAEGAAVAKSTATQIEAAATKSASGWSKATGAVTKHSAEITRVGTISTRAGIVAAAALALTAKSAIDWESAWTGVTKTVDGTTQQLADLEGQLRSMARTMPASHGEIAAVAEAAGQLGVKTADVASFTKTMIQLGATTNLSADEAATSLAQFMNIMGTSGDKVGNLGAAIVALGNAGASTERDIVQLGQRLAAVGKQVGMSEADVLSYANALASVGVEAEAGGTAMTMSFKKIDAAVRGGGASLELIAKTAGMTGAQFKQAFARDSALATATFVEGLGKIQASGGDVNALLRELGVTGIREADAMLRLAGATKAAGASQDLLRDSITLGRQSWKDSTALIEEYAKRAATTEAQVQTAWNQIKDAMIGAGEAILPIVAKLATAVGGAADAFGRMSPEAKNFAVASVAVVAGAGLAFGGISKLATSVAAASAAFKTLGISAKTATLSMGAIGLLLTGASMALGSYLRNQQMAKQAADDFTAALKESSGALNENVRMLMAKQLQDAGAFDAARQLGIGLDTVTDAAMGNAAAMEQVRAAQLAAIQADGNKIGASQKLGSVMEQQNGALATAKQNYKDMAEATGTAGDATSTLANQASKAKAQLQQQKQAMDDLINSTQSYGNQLLALSGSQIGVESAIAGVQEALKQTTSAQIQSGQALDLTTEAGRRNQQALNSLAQSSMAYVRTLAEQGAGAEEIRAATLRGRDAWVAGAVAMGMSSAKARELAAQYFAIPEIVPTQIKVEGADEALSVLGGIAGQLSQIKSKTVTVTVLQQSNVAGAPRMEADGGVLDFYAKGGIRSERHVAQIAPAGAWRVWAEPETGGEAYIPLAASKRERSMDILKSVAHRFGTQVVPYAGGGLQSHPMVMSRPSSDIDSAAIAAAVRSGMDGVGFQLLIDGQVVDARVQSVMNSRQRSSDVQTRLTGVRS